MNGGSISQNEAEQAGGVAVNYRGQFVMNGGSIEGNRARSAGGGIFAYMGSKMQMNGGKIHNNRAGNLGGGIAIYDEFSEGTSGTRQLSELARKNGFSWEDHARWRQLFDAKFEMNNGEITENFAQNGGGDIYVASSGVQINAGNISHNSSKTYGGGIYVSSVPYVLHLKNVYFENNRAIPQGGTFILTNEMLEGHGGAIWFCPTGKSQIFESNGASFNENMGEFSGDDFTLTRGGEYRLVSYFGQRLLGGGKVTWYVDGHPTDKSIARYLADNGQVYDDKVPEKISDPISLKAVANQAAALDLAKKLSKVTMIGNLSSRGGAIGSNGSVIIGDKDKTFNLKVDKKWAEALQDKVKDVELIIDLYNMTDPDHPVLIDTIILNQENDFSAYFEDLLLEAGNQKINYQLRERNHQDYQTSYDFRNIETNTSGVYEIDQQQDAHLEIYNEPKPDEPIPEDPTPEDPTPENPTPEDPTPENPTPEDPMPEKPFEPNLPEIPETEEPIKVEQMQVIGQLPETGEQDSTIWLGVAGLSILAGTAILIINKEDESI
ncbi:Cna B-type domain-containing protein [Ignavigranum ruoffiae]